MPADEQLPRVELLDVLGQDEHGQARQLSAGLDRRPQALVGEGRRQPHIHHRHVGAVREQRVQQFGPAVHGRHDLHAVGGQQPDQAVPQEGQVLAKDNSHGSSMVT